MQDPKEMEDKVCRILLDHDIDKVVNVHCARVNPEHMGRTPGRTCRHFTSKGWWVAAEAKGRVEHNEMLLDTGTSKCFLCDNCMSVLVRIVEDGLGGLAQEAQAGALRPSEIAAAAAELAVKEGSVL